MLKQFATETQGQQILPSKCVNLSILLLPIVVQFRPRKKSGISKQYVLQIDHIRRVQVRQEMESENKSRSLRRGRCG